MAKWTRYRGSAYSRVRITQCPGRCYLFVSCTRVLRPTHNGVVKGALAATASPYSKPKYPPPAEWESNSELTSYSFRCHNRNSWIITVKWVTTLSNFIIDFDFRYTLFTVGWHSDLLMVLDIKNRTVIMKMTVNSKVWWTLKSLIRTTELRSDFFFSLTGDYIVFTGVIRLNIKLAVYLCIFFFTLIFRAGCVFYLLKVYSSIKLKILDLPMRMLYTFNT